MADIVVDREDNIVIDLANIATLYPITQRYKSRQKTNSGKPIPYEAIDKSLYKAKAGCVSFVTTEERMHAWIVSLATLIYKRLGADDKYYVTWRDHKGSDGNMIHTEFIVSLKECESSDDFLYKVIAYITTGKLMVQGKSYKTWIDNHFKETLSEVNKLLKDSDKPCNDLTSDEDFTLDGVLVSDDNKVENEGENNTELDDSITKCKTVHTAESICNVRTAESVCNDFKTDIEVCTHGNFDLNFSRLESTFVTAIKDLSKSQYEVLKSSVADLSALFHPVIDKVDKLSACLAISKSRFDSDTELQQSKELNRQLLQKVDQMSNELDWKQRRIVEYQQQLNNSEVQLTKYKEQLDNSEFQLTQYRERLNSVELQFTKYREQLNSTEEQLTNYREQLAKQELYERDMTKSKSLSLHRNISNVSYPSGTNNDQSFDDVAENVMQTKVNYPSGASSNQSFDDVAQNVIQPKTGKDNSDGYMTQPRTGKDNSDGYINQHMYDEQTSERLTAAIVIDSHGNNLEADKLYRNNKAKVTILDAGKKTISGAKEFISENLVELSEKTELVLGVGSNDLQNKTVSEVLNEMSSLVKYCNENLPDQGINILPAFIRVGQKEFNRKVSKFNLELLAFETTHSKVSVIENREILDIDLHKELFVSDGIHFSHKGTLALVRILKSHLNTKLKLTPYDQYGDRYGMSASARSGPAFVGFGPNTRSSPATTHSDPMRSNGSYNPRNYGQYRQNGRKYNFNRPGRGRSEQFNNIKNPRSQMNSHFNLKSVLTDILKHL